MNPGALDQQITLQAQSSTLDAKGQRVDTWSDVATGVWAAVAIGGGREVMRAAKLYETIDAVFTIRYMAGLSSENRILYEGKPFDIIEVSPIGRREGLRLIARRYNAK